MSRVVVIGGGFAGLAAGVELAGRGLRPLVLEGRPHLGGRAYSFTDAASGTVVDNGQHALMGCYHHTLAFLRRIGAGDKLTRQANLRVAMAQRGLGSGTIACAPLPSPLHMLAGVLRYRLLPRGDRARALLGGMQLLRMHRSDDARLSRLTVAQILALLGQSPQAQACFWNPVAVATLNETPQRAAAAPFATVLARAFFGSRRDSQFVLPRVGLSELYTDDARRFIEQRGGSVDVHSPVAALELSDRGVEAVRLRDGRRHAAAACIAAVPPRGVAALLPDSATPAGLAGLERFAGAPIVSVHLWLDRPVLADPFLGMIGTTTQWVFNRSRLVGESEDGGQCLSAVISAAHDIAQWDNARIAATVVDDLRCLVPATRSSAVLRHVVVKEKYATISTTPAADRARPGAQTSIRNLFLAGDWTATGLPPTIESAVLSGDRAAQLVGAAIDAGAIAHPSHAIDGAAADRAPAWSA